MIIWLTGQPGSGKTTLGNELAHELPFLGFGPTRVIDGDILRGRLVPLVDDPYSEANRRLNVDRAQTIALMLGQLEWYPIVAVIAPYRDQRERFKDHCLQSTSAVLEVYLHTDEIRGKEDRFVEGYEPPESNFLDIDTGKMGIDECTKKICSVYREMAAATQGTPVVD